MRLASVVPICIAIAATTPGAQAATLPRPSPVAGHELAGVVAEVGPGVKHISVGQAVAVEPMQLAGCGGCEACRRGDTNICEQRGFSVVSAWISAGFSEFDVALGEHVYAVPDGIPPGVAALADVYACAVHAVHRVPVGPQDTVLIWSRPGGHCPWPGRRRLAGARRTFSQAGEMHRSSLR